MRDAVVVATTTMTYTLLYVGRFKNLAEVPLILAPADLLEFLQPPPALLGHKFMLEVEPILELEPLTEYIALPKLQPMSPNLPPLKPIILEMPIIDINSSNSPTPAVKLHQASDTSESDLSEETYTVASQVS